MYRIITVFLTAVLTLCGGTMESRAAGWFAGNMPTKDHPVPVTVYGGVDEAHCTWTKWPNFGPGGGNYLSVKTHLSNSTSVFKSSFRGMRPKSCREAVDMINQAPIWDRPLFPDEYGNNPANTDPRSYLIFVLYSDGEGYLPVFWMARITYYNTLDASPPKPATCSTYQVPSIDFGTVDPKEISGKKATSSVVVSCDKKASVRVRFMTREGLAIFQMDNGLTTYLKIDDNPGTAGSYQTVAENASSPARAFNLSAELLGSSGSVKPGAFSYTAVVRVDIL
ncbi:Uncharacterised protein [Serratia quinivorans]|nr:Uncharacterised protein [Serratia quinivorans]